MSAWDRFWFPAVPVGRFEAFRRVLYAYLLIDVLFVTGFARTHGSLDHDLYRPLLVGRILPLPVPTSAIVLVTMGVVLTGATLGAAGRASRGVALLTAVAYLEWTVIAFSYGKVNHDRLVLVAALFVSASIGRVRSHDRTPSEAAGWALRIVQVAVVAVYVLSVVAKVRYGGWLWANSATLTQALVRRGTSLGRPLLDHPGLIVGAQWATVVFETTSVVLLTRRRARWAWWGAAVVFHVLTLLSLGIGFYPQLVGLLAFLPLERLTGRVQPVRRHGSRSSSNGARSGTGIASSTVAPVPSSVT